MLITQIKPNPNNPRIIKDNKFKQLVKSIQDFPQMLELRPIVIDENNIVLGGNMRLKACQEAGLTEVPVVLAKDLTEEPYLLLMLLYDTPFKSVFLFLLFL